MIQYIEHSAIDKVKWDRCIEESLFRPGYALSWYLDIACDNCWDALVEGDYRSVMPLPRRRKAGISYVYPPYFIQQLGVFSREIPDAALISEFVTSIPGHFGYAEINLNSANEVSALDCRCIRNINTELHLNKPYTELASAFSDNLKRNLRKAGAARLTFTGEISSAEIISLFRNNKGAELGKFGDKEYKVLDLLIHESVRRNHGILTGVKNHEGNLIAAAFFVSMPGRLIFLFSGAAPEARTNAAIPFLLDEQIRKNSGQDVIMDFEGSNIKNIQRFYLSFGAKETHYHRIVADRLPAIAKYVIKWRRLMKKN